MRSECCEISRTSFLQVRVRSRSAWIRASGTKLLRIRPCASRSAIHIATERTRSTKTKDETDLGPNAHAKPTPVPMSSE